MQRHVKLNLNVMHKNHKTRHQFGCPNHKPYFWDMEKIITLTGVNGEEMVISTKYIVGVHKVQGHTNVYTITQNFIVMEDYKKVKQLVLQ